MAKCRGKGSQFERRICRQLSEWWTRGKRDDIFWRVKGSGGRAKRRGRAGKQTSYQSGDIYATDPIGIPLMDVLTIECKKGYSKWSIQDILDRPNPRGKEQQKYEEWIEQAHESHIQAGSLAWMLIVGRNARKDLAIFPTSFENILRENDVVFASPVLRMHCCLRFFPDGEEMTYSTEITAVTLEEWLRAVTPKLIKRLSIYY